MAKKPVNEVCCKDCLLSGWDVDVKGVWFSCGCRIVPEKTMAVRTAMKFLVAECNQVKHGNRHGSGPGTWTVFEIASGKHLEQPQDGSKARPLETLPMDPISRLKREEERTRRKKEDQSRLGDFFKGAKTSKDFQGAHS